jgi:hypothetical protein
MSEFGKNAEFGKKAEKFFGLGGGAGETVAGFLQVQREGWMWKKPLTGTKAGAWQKRYFVLKDAFLFWYDSKPAQASFNWKPKGCLPMGGANVFPMGKEGSAFVFEVAHVGYDTMSLLLKVEDKLDADDWIRVLNECRKATFANAVVGNAQLARIKSVGTRMEKDMQEALEEIQKKATEIEAAREQKLQTMMEHMEQQRQHDLEVSTKLYETHKLRNQVEEAERKAEEQRLAKLTEAQLRAEVESRLAAAKQQVIELAAALKERQAMYPSLAQNFDSAFSKIEKFLSSNPQTS